jgi:hypothetical protein
VELENKRINGFVICENLEIVNRIIFEERDILGEHSIVHAKGEDYLIFYNYHHGKYFLSLMNIENPKEIIDIQLDQKIELGFHSLFLRLSS